MSQKGFAHIFLIIVLLLGLVAGVYLVSSGNPLKLFSKASESDTQKKIINSLTAELLQKKDKYNNLTKSGQVSVQAQKESLDNLTAVAIRRKEELSKLIEKDPQAFLDTAKLVDQKNTFPKQIQAYLEEKGEIKGKLTVVHEDDFINKQSKYLYRVQTDDKEYSLYFTKNPPPLSTDSVVSVSGTALGMALATDPSKQEGNQSLKIVTQALSTTTGEQKTAVLLVKFADNQSEPYSVSQVRSMMFEGSDSVDSYYRENSSNQAYLSGNVFGWYTINTSLTGCDYDAFAEWADKADQAAQQAGNTLSGYSRRIYLFPKDCTSRGTLGGFPSRSWITRVNLPDIRIIEHELGHNFGAHHSNAFSCGSFAINDYSRCNNLEYGEIYDVMGSIWATTSSFRFNSPHQLALGWIPQSAVQTVTTEGTYTVSPLYQQESGIKILQIRKPDTLIDWYYLSYRQPTGFDSNLPNGITDGVNIHIWDSYSSIPTKFIDTSPADSEGFANASLSDGETLTDSINGITVKQLRHDTNSATVEIRFTGPAPTPTPSGFQVLQNWRTVTPLPQVDAFFGTVAYNNYIYKIGGEREGSGVYYSEVNSDGINGSWRSTTPLPRSLLGHATVIHNNRIFVLGGSISSGAGSSTVYSATIGSNGTLGGWSTLTPLPIPLYKHAAIIVKGHIFVIGGYDSTGFMSKIYAAKINDNGSLGNWNTVISLPTKITNTAVVSNNDYLFIVGGRGEGREGILDSVYSTQVNDDGTLSPLRSLGALPLKLDSHAAVAWDNNIYTIGGTTYGYGRSYRTLDKLYKAQINNDGTLGVWTELTYNKLPEGRYFHSAVTVNNSLFVLGGIDSSALSQVRAEVYSAAFNRLITPSPTPTPIPRLISISQGNNTISFPWLPSTNLKADDIINGFNNQGFRVRAISRWDSTGRWITRIPGTPINNFDIRVGEGYWIKNEGNAGILNLERLEAAVVEAPAKSSPSSFVCTPCIADINKDKSVNMKDYSYWVTCKSKGINSNPVCKNADLNKDGKVGGDPEFKCITSQMGKKC